MYGFGDGGTVEKRREAEPEVAGLKMLRFSSRMERIKNRKTAKVKRFGDRIMPGLYCAILDPRVPAQMLLCLEKNNNGKQKRNSCNRGIYVLKKNSEEKLLLRFTSMTKC